MEFDHVVRKRKMIRKYLPNKIPDRIISKLIKNASRAPSAGHTQVQKFIIVRDPTIKKKLMQASVNQKAIEEAPLLIVVCSNTSRSVGRDGQRGEISIAS
jgi:nitroreductase